MSNGFLRFGLPVLLLSLAGCDRAEVAVTTAPTAVTASFTSSALGFEPSRLRPEPLPAASCGIRSRFGTRIIIIVRDAGVSLLGVRFRFTDFLGVTALPWVSPIPGTAPLSAPISTFPTSPIPVPGIAPMPMRSPIPIPGTSQTLPFFLAFDCGVGSEGTLTVFLDTADGNGVTRTSELRARIVN